MSDTRLKPIHVIAMLAAVAVAVTAGELLYKAEAQEQQDNDNDSSETATKNVTWSVMARPAMDVMLLLLDIDGSVNITEEVANQILSSAQVSFTEAATIAADSVNGGGRVLNGNLGVISGFLVYSFTVVNKDNRIY